MRRLWTPLRRRPAEVWHDALPPISRGYTAAEPDRYLGGAPCCAAPPWGMLMSGKGYAWLGAIITIAMITAAPAFWAPEAAADSTMPARPTADAGPDRTVDEGATVMLDGSGSSHPDNIPLHYEWVQTSGPAVELSYAGIHNPKFTAPQVDATTRLVFTLYVGGNFTHDSDGITITIRDTDGRTVQPPPGDAPTPRIPPSLPSNTVDDTAPTITKIERVGNGTRIPGEGGPLLFNVTFSEPVVGVNATDFALLVDNMTTVHLGNATLVNATSHPNATIPDLGTLNDTIWVAEPGPLANGTVRLDLDHIITASLDIRLVAPDCSVLHLHNQTFAFLYELAGPHHLEPLAGTNASGPWTIVIEDRARFWDGVLRSWSLYLSLGGPATVTMISETTYQVAAWPAAEGRYLLGLSVDHDIADRAGNALADAEPAGPNHGYLVVPAEAPSCGRGGGN